MCVSLPRSDQRPQGETCHGESPHASGTEIDDGQREELERWLRRSRTGQALALRARIVLACAEGESDVSVAARLGTTRATVGKGAGGSSRRM